VLHLVKLVEDLSLRSVESRLARMLIDGSASGVIQRHRWTTQAEMAARLGTVPDVVNRALRKLVEEGAIELDRHQIRLLDPDLLRSKAMIEP
jgi:CRP/FNR family transcriptional regulator